MFSVIENYYYYIIIKNGRHYADWRSKSTTIGVNI